MENNILENFIDVPFRIGRLHGRLGLPKMNLKTGLNSVGEISNDSYEKGYDHGMMERKTARTTNEEVSIEEKHLSKKQKEIAALSGDKDELDSGDFKVLRSKFRKKIKPEKETEQFGGLPEEFEIDIEDLDLNFEGVELDEISSATLQSYVDKAETSKKDHLQANIMARKPEVQKFHDRIMVKRHNMQQKAISKLKNSIPEETELDEALLDEVLSKDDPASKWIDDFVHSDDPKFKGKSKEERIKMALGAYYGNKK